jgi:addiction module RelB/DinJ family antitoxin
MAATTMIHVRVDEHIVHRATETLSSMGLRVSDGVRVLLTGVAAGQRLPFVLQAPNVGPAPRWRGTPLRGSARLASAYRSPSH